jgi:kynurenine formamidase
VTPDDAQLQNLLLGAKLTDDAIFMHLQSGTQWDGLPHVFYDEQLYNGVPSDAIDHTGASRLGIAAVAPKLVSRAVLLDAARWRGLDVLEDGDALTSDDLEAISTAQGTEVRSGDIVLLRTGVLGQCRAAADWRLYKGRRSPGLHCESAVWLHDQEVAALAADNSAVEAYGPELAIPFHMLALRDMGMVLGEFWHLDELAFDSARDGVFECFLAAQGLMLTRAVGTPTTAVAIK